MEKECKKCLLIKPLVEFGKKKMGYLGHDSWCKLCKKASSAQKYAENPEKFRDITNKYKRNNKEAISERGKIYEEKRKDIRKEQKRIYYIENREEILDRQKTYHEANWDKKLEYEANRKKTDINYRLSCSLRSRISNFLKGIGFKNGSAIDDLGCTIDFFKDYLASKFTKGMSWDNYGEWHIDHIKALANFDLTNREQFLEATHYTNMQPLWAIDNIRKGKR